MKVGDFVGWADHEDSDDHIRPAGIILDSHYPTARAYDNENYMQFLILLQHNGDLSWEYGSDLVVMCESR